MGSINAWVQKGVEAKPATAEDETHQAISSWFIGPQCENLPFFRRNVTIILDELEKARGAYFPGDGVSLHLDILNSTDSLGTDLLDPEIHHRRHSKFKGVPGLHRKDRTSSAENR